MDYEQNKEITYKCKSRNRLNVKYVNSKCTKLRSTQGQQGSSLVTWETSMHRD